MQTEDKVKNELIDLEKKYWQSMQDKDLKTAVSLTDFPCLLASAHGVQSIDQAQFEKMFHSHQEEMKDFEMVDEPRVRMLNESTAVIAYQIKSRVSAKGKTRQIHAVDNSTWVKRGDRWACAMHAEAEVRRPW